MVSEAESVANEREFCVKNAIYQLTVKAKNHGKSRGFWSRLFGCRVRTVQMHNLSDSEHYLLSEIEAMKLLDYNESNSLGMWFAGGCVGSVPECWYRLLHVLGDAESFKQKYLS